MDFTRQRIVVKIGTGVLTRDDRIRLDEPAFVEIARSVAGLVAAGHEVVLVSSGAVGAGLMEFGVRERPNDTATLQAFAAIGQARLMQTWRTHLQVRDLAAAQLLLTYADLESDERSQRILLTLERLLAMGHVVPIINENDSVAVEELRFGDNDALSARVAVLARASLLVLLTTVDGLLDMGDGGRLVPVVADPDAVGGLVREDKGALSVGGMRTKLEAVRLARRHGIPAIIAHGKHADRLPGIVAGLDQPCTRFPVAAAIPD
jgi:glutamate 5-kinase